MDYREKLKPGKRVNAFYLPSDPDLELLELQSPDSDHVYLWEWDDKQQKVTGRWVDTDKT